MALKQPTILLFLLAAFLFGCTSVQHISRSEVKYETVQSSQDYLDDVDINQIIAPYKAQIDAEMNEVIGTVAQELTKRKPESTLGNWYVDAMMAGALKEDPEVDFAIANYGGLRVPYLSPGSLTRGQLFELSPFDNLLVIVQVPGDILDSMMHQLAATGGWPVSKEIKMSINDNKLMDCTIKGKPVNSSAIYKVAMPDYIANGGDGFSLLIPLTRTQSGILVRDVIIQYAIDLTKRGNKIDASLEGRVVYVKN